VNPTQLIAKCQSHAERERKQGGYCQVSFSQESPPLQATKHHTNYLAIQKKEKKKPVQLTQKHKNERVTEKAIYI
jgi:hypothetical protein